MKRKLRVLFCDDSGGVHRGFLRHVAEPLADLLEATTAASPGGVRQRIEQGEEYDVVVTDLNFENVGGGPKDGLEIVEMAREAWPECRCILMTAFEGSLDVRDGQRLQALGVGPESLLAKTEADDPGETWARLVERLKGIAQAQAAAEQCDADLRRENRLLREALGVDTLAWAASLPVDEAAAALRADPDFRDLGQIGRSAPMREVFRRIRRAARLPSDVLVLGETGTGKELVARAIHALSARKDAPFVKADLTASTPTLVESELFGHRRGAFTGAEQDREGLLRAASGGTFFLDEIGNVPLEVQAKLLRLLEDRRFRPLGSDRDLEADVRVVAATNADLPREVEEGRFRADLYERLNVLRVELPPLRRRSEDVPLLAVFFLDEFRRRFGTPGLRRIEREALEVLADQRWPRNVRQLRHSIERLFAEVEPEEEVVTAEHVRRALEPDRDAAAGEEDQAIRLARRLLRQALEGELSATPAEIKRRHGEEVVREFLRRAMLHFRGLPDDDECREFFGGVSANAWRQFAYQHGLTWKKVRQSLE